MVSDVLIYADTSRSPELRHEVPVEIGDPFLYVERNGSRHLVLSALEAPRLQGLSLELRGYEEFGADAMLRPPLRTYLIGGGIAEIYACLALPAKQPCRGPIDQCRSPAATPRLGKADTRSRNEAVCALTSSAH